MPDSWHAERRRWNAEGRCAIKACQASLADGYGVHRDTDLRYCLEDVTRLRAYNGHGIIREVVHPERT